MIIVFLVKLQKLMSTYVEGMMSCVVSGSITTHWDQTAAATGRLTSSQPNIQAIPKAVITVTHFQANYVIGKLLQFIQIFFLNSVSWYVGCYLY